MSVVPTPSSVAWLIAMITLAVVATTTSAVASKGGDAAGAQCQATSKATIEGHDVVPPTPCGSAALCCDLCAAMPTCKAAVFDTTARTCSRKSVTAPTKAAKDGVTLLVPSSAHPTTPQPSPSPSGKLELLWANTSMAYINPVGYVLGNRMLLAGHCNNIPSPYEYNCAMTLDAMTGRFIEQSSQVALPQIVDPGRRAVLGDDSFSLNATFARVSSSDGTFVVVWETEGNSPLQSPAAASPDLAYVVATVNGPQFSFYGVRGLNGATGSTLWTLGNSSAWYHLTAAYQFTAVVYIGGGSCCSHLMVVDMATGIQLFEFATAYSAQMSWECVASPVATIARVACIADAYAIFVFDANTGATVSTVSIPKGSGFALVHSAVDAEGFFVTADVTTSKGMQHAAVVGVTWDGVVGASAEIVRRSYAVALDRKKDLVYVQQPDMTIAALNRSDMSQVLGSSNVCVANSSSLAVLQGFEGGVVAHCHQSTYGLRLQL